MFVRSWRRAIALVALVALVGVACGGDDDDDDVTGGTGGDGGGEVDPEGVLRIGQNLATANGIFFDLTTQVSVPLSWHPMIYDTLLRRTVEGGSEPGLAREATIEDASTISVLLHEGITFTDGTAVDAEAVKFGIERNINEGQPGSFEAELFELESIEVEGPLSLTINLKSPVAGAWYRLLSLPETSPVSPTAVGNGVDFNQNPVGAGPFMLESFAPEDHVRLVKNPDFFQADDIRLGGVEYVHVQPDALQNALLSGSVDMVPALPFTVGQGLAGGDLEVQTEVTDNRSLIGHICKDRPPFDDLRVRQAINYAIDREALNEGIYEGLGEPMWGFFAADSPFHNDDLDGFYEHDPDRARELLAEAGQSDLAFDVFFTQGPEGQRSAEILQSQLAEVGVSISIEPLVAQTDFFPDAKGAPMYFFPLSRAGLNKVTRVYVPGSYGNVCTWDDPELTDLVRELQAIEEDSPEGVDLWHQIQEHAMETALTIFGLFTVESNAWDDDKLGDVDFLFIATAPVPDFYNIYVKG